MKIIFISLAFSFAALTGIAQNGVGIGTGAPNANAILDLTSISKGLLLPRLNTSQRTGMGSVAGMVVYDTDLKLIYQHDGSSWRQMLNSTFWTASTTRNYIYKQCCIWHSYKSKYI